jgi:hypothetical protein
MKNILILSLLILTSCGKLGTDIAAPTTPTVQAELAECTTNTSYSSPVIITGTASFYKRGLIVTAASSIVTKLILGQPIATPLPIRFAEIRVLNASGIIIQCGKTNSVGALKALDGIANLQISNTAGTYTIEVLARSNQNMTVTNSKPIFKSYLAVKEDIYSNTVYKISSTITSTGSGSYPTTLTATALESSSAKIEGGAFNIYNDVITTYDYFANLPDGSVDFTCLSPKFDVFWRAGFNPAKYIYPTQDEATLGTISFYLQGENELYINGGVVGNVLTEDTDHFDDGVIIHETGHRIEDVCGRMDSPGGSHSARFRIDPRLAWSEGFGNFLAAHIMRNKLSDLSPLQAGQTLPNNEWLFYYDSGGYEADGTSPYATGSEYIRINVAKTAADESTYDPVNPTLYPGEGHFREISIARGLFKGVNTCTNPGAAPHNNCLAIPVPFADYWKALGRTSSGMGQTIYPYRSSARFISRVKAVQSGTLNAAWNTLLSTDEALQPDGHADYTVGGFKIWVPYGINLVSGACSLKIQPASSVTFANNLSDQRYANHFYTVDPTSLAGITSINITSATGNAKIQLLQEGYQFNEGALATSSVSLSGLDITKKYLLNIRLNSGAESTYTLTNQSGGILCPASSL